MAPTSGFFVFQCGKSACPRGAKRQQEPEIWIFHVFLWPKRLIHAQRQLSPTGFGIPVKAIFDEAANIEALQQLVADA
jgi:hypothetical protein